MRSTSFRQRGSRTRLLRIGVLAAVFSIAPFWTWQGPGLCLFHRVTGLDCPGCGMTRAFHAISRGQFAQALDLNILSLAVYALFLLVLLNDIVYVLTGMHVTVPARLRLEGAFGYFALFLVMGYGVARNLTPW